MVLACTDASCKCWIGLRFGQFGGQIDSFGCLSCPPKWSLGILRIHLFIYFAVESGVFPVEVAVIGRCDSHAENRTAAKSVTLEASALRSIITVGGKKKNG